MSARPAWLLLGLLALLPAGCGRPPPEAYVNAPAAAGQAPLGENAAGEACALTTEAAGGDIYCGGWVQPAGRLRAGAPEASLRAAATGSAWRRELDLRFACGEPTASTLEGGMAAMVLPCTRRLGGWPHVALVADAGGTLWYADGVAGVFALLERAVAIRAGRAAPTGRAGPSPAAALVAERLAARSYGAADIQQYDQLIEAGTRANLADDAPRAEAAFRAALAVQERALGREDPNLATPLTYLALQLSNQDRGTEAGQVFARAARLVDRAADPLAPARLLHYRALHAQNSGQPGEALDLLDAADRAYRRTLPPDALSQRPGGATSRFARAGAGNLQDLLPARELVGDPRARTALFGLIEVWRNRALALRDLGRGAESLEAIRDAGDLARANGLSQPLLLARLHRTAAMIEAAAGHHAEAAAALDRASAAFERVLPDSRPAATTRLVRARQLALAGREGEALAECRTGVAILTALRTGTDPDFIAGCLDIFAARAARVAAERPALHAEMFAAAQVAQGGITSQQIAQATARLGENARDPRVGDAIRARQDADARLAALYRRRDDLVQRGAEPASLEADIAAALAAQAEADSALQAAAPNYGQLIQKVVSAAEVQSALRPGEGFLAMTLDADGGWVFLLRRERVAVARIAGGLGLVAPLVRRLRASIENDGTSPLPRFDTAAARALYAATLGGVAAEAEGLERLSIAPAGPLLAIPFDVLLTGPADADALGRAPWLVRRFTLVHVPSPGNFVSLRRVAGGSRASRAWFGFGEFRPITAEQARRSFPTAECAPSARRLTRLAALPYAQQELEAARLLMEAGRDDELTGADFTAERVRRQPLRDYRVLQFSSHALLPSEIACQAEPAIVTSAPSGAGDAGGAMLSASQIAALNLDADLVILSACNSGGADGAVAGESLSGLARSFFYAGARALMVTHWSVNDQTAAYLVADMLRRLRDDPRLDVAAALRATTLAMIDGAGGELNADVAHPFYWAPFALIGEGGGRLRRGG